MGDDLHRTLDPATVFDSLVRGLAAPDLAQRDASTRAALHRGAAFAAHLLASPAEGLSDTAHARRAWTFAAVHGHRAADRLGDPPPVDLAFRGPLAGALAALAQRRGLTVARDLPAADAAVDVALRGVTYLEALDAVCRSAGVRPALHGGGVLRVEAGAGPAYPTAYVGPCRVQVRHLVAERATDFTTTRARIALRLGIDWEWPFAPVSPPHVRCDPAAIVDDPTTEGVGAEVVVTLTDLATGAAELRLGLEVGGVFRARWHELRVPADGVEVASHGLAARVEHPSSQRAQLVWRAVDPGRVRADVGLVGLASTVLVIDDAGEERLADVHRIRAVGGAADGERWSLSWRGDLGRIVELRARIASSLVEHAFRVRLPPLALP